jgi:hypothetical protein
MVFERSRIAERAQNRMRVIAEAAFGGIGGGKVEQLASAGGMAGQRLREAVWLEVPAGARSKHVLALGYWLLALGYWLLALCSWL